MSADRIPIPATLSVIIRYVLSFLPVVLLFFGLGSVGGCSPEPAGVRLRVSSFLLYPDQITAVNVMIRAASSEPNRYCQPVQQDFDAEALPLLIEALRGETYDSDIYFRVEAWLGDVRAGILVDRQDTPSVEFPLEGFVEVDVELTTSCPFAETCENTQVCTDGGCVQSISGVFEELPSREDPISCFND